jgi:transmembrane sensor
VNNIKNRRHIVNIKQNIKDLFEKFVSNRISSEDRKKLFELVNKETDEAQVTAWFYKEWDQAPMKKPKADSRSSLDELKIKLNITPELEESFSNINIDTKSKSHYLYIQLAKYAAVFISAVIITSAVYYFLAFQKEAVPPILNEITVPVGSKTMITLSDNTKIWLNSGSKLTYFNYSDFEKREVYLEGEAFFDVTENKHKPFIVKTSDIQVKVLGTKFNVKSYPEENYIETTLITGLIEIEEISTAKEQKMNITLHPNQKATFTRTTRKLALDDVSQEKMTPRPIRKISIIEKIDPEPITSWKDNKLIFNNELFKSLLPKLERWYNVDIQLEDTVINNYRYTGLFEKETVEQALDALKLATPFEYSINKNVITIVASDE